MMSGPEPTALPTTKRIGLSGQAPCAWEHLRPDLDRSDSGPFDDFVALERSTRVHAAISQLDDKSKQLLALAFFQGLSHQEIADHTRLPLGSVKTVLRTAMLKLQGILGSIDPLEKSS